jgi:hypothetical protein
MEKVNQLINNNFEIREDIWDYFIFNKIDDLKTKKINNIHVIIDDG